MLKRGRTMRKEQVLKMTVNIKRTFSTLNCSKLKNNAARLAFAPLQNNAARLASLGVLHIAHVHTILQT